MSNMLEDPGWNAFLETKEHFGTPEPCHYVEICHYRDGEVESDHGILQSAKAVDWLDKGVNGQLAKFVPSAERPITGRSRMIIFPKRMGDIFATLPMSSDSVRALVENVGLSSRFFSSHVKHRRIATRLPTERGYALLLRNWKVSVVTLHRKQDNSVLSLVIIDDGGKHLKAEHIIAKIVESKGHSLHPFMAVLILSDHALEDYRKNCDDAMAESELIHHYLGLSVSHLGLKQRSTEIARKSTEKHSALAVDRETLIQLCGSLKSLLDSFEALRSFHQQFAPPPNSALANHIEASGDTCTVMLEYLTITCKDMLSRMQQIETRLQWLFPMLQLRQAQQDTKLTIRLAKTSAQAGVAAQRDSSSMMVIAVLTTLFLPGTFVATLMSAPGYANTWSMDDSWKYWAVTLPLTAVVMVLVALWWYRIRSDNKEEDERVASGIEANFVEESELVTKAELAAPGGAV